MEINKQVNLLDSADLRMRAEQQCKEYAKDLSSKLITDEKRLLHELQVYKIELEMQNEDLRNALILADEARTEAEYAKESYIKLFDFAPMSYFILGQEGVIQKINFHGARLLGNQRSKLVGQQFRYYVKPEDLPIYQLFLKAVFSGENKQACELKIQTGETQYYLSLEAIANQTEKSCLMTAVDISDRKLKETQEKLHLKELAHATRLGLMGEMASGIAHEINQPLTAISNYTQVSINLINSEHADLENLAQIAYKTQQQALRAGQIIHRMREFIRTDTKHRSTVEVNATINEAVSLIMDDIKQNKIEFSLNLENNLPPVYADHIQIEQVLINLIRNSIDAMKPLPEYQRRLSIHSKLTADNKIQVRVKDNGPGLTQDQQQKIFQPFYTTKTYGMGMGLSICRALIEAHKGVLRFNSKLGKGTSFYFTLPV